MEFNILERNYRVLLPLFSTLSSCSEFKGLHDMSMTIAYAVQYQRIQLSSVWPIVVLKEIWYEF
jgi:hypothetical protein